MGFFLSDLCTWYFSCRMPILRCSVSFHVGCWFCLYFKSWMFWSFGGVDVLSLSSHMSLFCFFIFREEFGDILDVDEWPGEIFSSLYYFDLRGFFWKAC